MTTLLLILVLLAVLGVLGTVVEGLLWLTLIAIVLFLAGAGFSWFKFRSWRAS